MTPAEILVRAADVIERNGWAQHAYVLPKTGLLDLRECPVCALGAINIAYGAQPNALVIKGPKFIAAKYLADRVDPDDVYDLDDMVGRIGQWNDYICQNADEVKAELRAAAAEWEATR